MPLTCRGGTYTSPYFLLGPDGSPRTVDNAFKFPRIPDTSVKSVPDLQDDLFTFPNE